VGEGGYWVAVPAGNCAAEVEALLHFKPEGEVESAWRKLVVEPADRKVLVPTPVPTINCPSEVQGMVAALLDTQAEPSHTCKLSVVVLNHKVPILGELGAPVP